MSNRRVTKADYESGTFAVIPGKSAWYVVQRKLINGQPVIAHRDTSKSKSGALRMAAELRRGVRAYDPAKGHTVPVKGSADPDPLAALLKASGGPQ